MLPDGIAAEAASSEHSRHTHEPIYRLPSNHKDLALRDTPQSKQHWLLLWIKDNPIFSWVSFRKQRRERGLSGKSAKQARSDTLGMLYNVPGRLGTVCGLTVNIRIQGTTVM